MLSAAFSARLFVSFDKYNQNNYVQMIRFPTILVDISNQKSEEWYGYTNKAIGLRLVLIKPAMVINTLI